MPSSSQFTRSALIAATVISIAASPAMARPADQPARSKAAATTVTKHTQRWTQPRVDGTGVRPADRPAVAAAPAAPLTRAAETSGGADWLLITLAAATVLLLLTVVAALHPLRHRAQSLRAR